jgi:mRNA interferase YafQ
MAKGSPQPPARDLTPAPSSKFRKDWKRLEKQHKDMDKLTAIIATLCAREPLAASHRDHALVGPWKWWRECHVAPDWLLIYKQVGDELILGRTGSHSEIFG